ncbi:DUF2490 domain-containing protein [Altererythrobacter sp. Root672]|uniref:DUF2490 domain-containing protein n=1 Tax=Altererythrobacter sp. Root672 TaxID=1736584 RepID=UPI0006F32046|nr:DUF2490 domain-containing protein [Altererythrobacter sp. Root672]KRA83776.1 hypothetical protein ASD76_07090 [Altererythrobacter sp. Root672]
MLRTTAFSVLTLTTAGIATSAQAADEDTQLWLSQSFQVPLVEHQVTGTLDLSQRVRESGNQLLTRGMAELRLSEDAVVGGGAAYVETFDSPDEFRPHQQLTLTSGMWSFRTRVEERFFEGADRMELRLRQKITATWPLAKELKGSLAGELLYTARAQTVGDDPHIDQWRATGALTYKLSPKVEGTVGYLMILSPRDGAEDKLSHVAQVSLTYKG